MSITYQQSGVDISAGESAVNLIKNKVKSTFSSHVLTGLGGFGGVFDIKEATKEYKHPVLVQSIDGVGTKMMVAKMMGMYENIGKDLVGNVVGDILAMGAKPLTFLDYIANEKLRPEIVEKIISGAADSCIESNISLIGGETAEMPGVYQKDEIDVAGVVTGVIEKDSIITGEKIKVNDVVLGIPSSGIHTNGFSLARKLFFEIGKLKPEQNIPELQQSIGETLLTPHTNYTNQIHNLLNSDTEIKGIAHITGGGLIENIPRILPQDCSVDLNKNSWFIHPIFEVMQGIGDVAEYEMFRTFNMGIGMVIITDETSAQKIKQIEKVYEIGRVVQGERQVNINTH